MKATAKEKAAARTLTINSQRGHIVISDNIGVRCGCAPGKTWIGVLRDVVREGRWWKPVAYVECKTCTATWIWGES